MLTQQAALTLALSLALSGAGVNSCQKGGGTNGARVETRKAENVNASKAAGEGADPFASIPRVGVRELERALKEGKAVVVDVGPEEAFEAEHIKGAASIPLEEVNARAGELPKDKLVVAYCA
ncbi:MAG TPA: rhodanese-like domain-containing protein [Pyrinomonadaceae bacterium]|nr:rhodanese-like domain-containing protein [Pyrinomonadaceae bacterium]